MAYITYNQYTQYGGALTQAEFDRFSYDAQRYVDLQTTGIDNVKKLKVAFPTDTDDAEAVYHCLVRIIDILDEIDKANAAMGLVTDSNGITHGVVSSVSSGSESISYGGSGLVGMTQKAAASNAEKNTLIYSEIRRYLSGITDANGVNLLYMGRYPVCIKTP